MSDLCPQCPEGNVNIYFQTEHEPVPNAGHTHRCVVKYCDCKDCDYSWTTLISAHPCYCGWTPDLAQYNTSPPPRGC